MYQSDFIEMHRDKNVSHFRAEPRQPLMLDYSNDN